MKWPSIDNLSYPLTVLLWISPAFAAYALRGRDGGEEGWGLREVVDKRRGGKWREKKRG